MRSIVLLLLLVAGATLIFVTRSADRPPRAEVATRAAAVAPAVTVKSSERESLSITSNGTELTLTVRGPGLNEKEAEAAAYANAITFLVRRFNLRQEITPKDLEATRVGQGEYVSADPERPGDGVIVKETFHLDSTFLTRLAVQERQYRTDERMAWLLRGLAVSVAGLFAISGYVRLDEWSKGYLSGVLKVAAVVAVVGVGVAVFLWR